MTINEIFLVLSSIFGTAALFNIALYFGYHRKSEYLFFSLYCVFHVFKVWLKTFPEEALLIPLLSLTVNDLVYLSVVFGLYSLNVFFFYLIDYRNKVLYALILAPIFIAAYILFSENVFIYTSVSLAIAQCIYSLRSSSNLSIHTTGLILLLILSYFGVTGIVPFGYFIGTIILVALMMIASSKNLAKQTKELNAATLLAAQLENQLLKSTIRPHFILNSLTSLQELIEHEPEKGSEFIQNLSALFQFFSKSSDQKLIPIEKELELVHSFLNIMSTRQNKSFSLSTENLVDTDLIPPGIFLTLVENGITHGFSDQSIGDFSIRKEIHDNGIIYRISNNGSTPEEIEEGIGLQFVRSRLKESYLENFDLLINTSKSGFETSILIYD